MTHISVVAVDFDMADDKDERADDEDAKTTAKDEKGNDIEVKEDAKDVGQSPRPGWWWRRPCF